MFIITIIIIFIPITQQPEQDRWAENQPMAGLSSLNEYEYEYENGMRKSKTELEEANLTTFTYVIKIAIFASPYCNLIYNTYTVYPRRIRTLIVL